MPTTPKHLLRLAAAISAQLASHVGQEPLFELPTRYWQQGVDIVRQIRRAQLRGWHLAARELRTDLHYIIMSVRSELTAINRRLPHAMHSDRLASANDI